MVPGDSAVGPVGSASLDGTPSLEDWVAGIAGTAMTGEAGDTGERLQKVLAKSGLGSRRTCEQLIVEGRVRVNGAPARLGQRADGDHDLIEVDGIPLPVRQGLAYYLLNKPVGVVCSAADPQGRQTVLDLLPGSPRVFPVGRLDISSEGLLVVTNDGELAFQLTHPSFSVTKEYVVEVEGKFSKDAVGHLRRGVQLDDGITAPAKVSQLAPNSARISIHEGRNRQVRRMCEAVGNPVRRLVRTRIGPISDPALEPGKWRDLTVREVRDLWQAARGPLPGVRTTSISAGT
jgi:23S rRNA pseudouridine2605 synthase